MNCYTSFKKQLRIVPIYPEMKTDVTIQTHCDVAYLYSMNSTKLVQSGLLPASFPDLRIAARKKEIHAILLRLLFNPSPELCELINSYTKQFSNAFVIGLQFRMGGKLANADDAVFLRKKQVVKVVEEVKTMIKNRPSTQPVIVFISTDSLSIRKYVVNAFAPPVKVMYVKEFDVGHTAIIYNRGMKSAWESIMKQTIMDMMVLKECDYLFVTAKSSFGKLAVELQQSYKMPVSVEWFLNKRGLQCSVFHRKKAVGTSRFISSVCCTNTSPIQVFH